MAADPLAPHAPRPAGLVAWKVAAVAGTTVAVGLLTFMAWGGTEPHAERRAARLSEPREPEVRDYADLRREASVQVPERPPEKAPEAAPAQAAPRLAGTEPEQTVEARERPRGSGGGRAARDDLWEKALGAGVGGWSADGDEREALDGVQVASASGAGVNPMGLPTFASAACPGFVKPGTPIRATLVNKVVTERGGIATLNVDADVWNTGMDVLAVPGASTMTMEYSTGATRGQKRVEFANPTIVRPFPRSDMVQLAAMTADSSGASGVPGHTNVPWFQTGFLVAASTAVELGVAALSGGGSLIGAILADNAESPLDAIAKDLWDRAPVIELDPGEQVLVFLRGGMCADDFRQ